MKSLVEIYDDIDHKCNEESISEVDKTQMLWSAAQEYVENLQKSDRWKSIIKFDIELLKIHSSWRDGHYSFGAETFLILLIREVERYGFNIDDIINPHSLELVQPEIIPETGNSDGDDGDGDDDDGDDEDEDNGQIRLPLALDTQKARDLFTAAYNQGWIEGSEAIGYRWIGFGNISNRTKRTVSCTNQLAYLCYKIYYPLPPSWSEIDAFFGENRLDRDWSNIHSYVRDNQRPPWMNTIDHLIINSGY